MLLLHDNASTLRGLKIKWQSFNYLSVIVVYW